MNENTYWGYHLSLDLTNCDPRTVTNPVYLNEWVKELVRRIDMVAFGEPQIVHFAEDDPNKAGWTVNQLIETSNIMAHFLDNGDGYLDIFSCKPFKKEDVLENIDTWFSPEFVIPHFRIRQAHSPQEDPKVNKLYSEMWEKELV